MRGVRDHRLAAVGWVGSRMAWGGLRDWETVVELGSAGVPPAVFGILPNTLDLVHVEPRCNNGHGTTLAKCRVKRMANPWVGNSLC